MASHGSRRRIWQAGNTDSKYFLKFYALTPIIYNADKKYQDLLIEAIPPVQCCRLQTTVSKQPLQVLVAHFNDGRHDRKIYRKRFLQNGFIDMDNFLQPCCKQFKWQTDKKLGHCATLLAASDINSCVKMFHGSSDIH